MHSLILNLAIRILSENKMPTKTIDDDSAAAAAAALLLQRNSSSSSNFSMKVTDNSNENQLATLTNLKKRGKKTEKTRRAKRQKKEPSGSIQQLAANNFNNIGVYRSVQNTKDVFSTIASNLSSARARSDALFQLQLHQKTQAMLSVANANNNKKTMYHQNNTSLENLRGGSLYGNSSIPQQLAMPLQSLHFFLQSQKMGQQQQNHINHPFASTNLKYDVSRIFNKNSNEVFKNGGDKLGEFQNNRNLATMFNDNSYGANIAHKKIGPTLQNKHDPETKRLVHNLAEKRRQHRINDYINTLRQIMFDYSQKPIPKGKAKILQNTIDFIQTLVEDNCTLHKQYQQLQTALEKVDDNNATILLSEALHHHDMSLHWGRGEAIRGATRTLQRLQNGND